MKLNLAGSGIKDIKRGDVFVAEGKRAYILITSSNDGLTLATLDGQGRWNSYSNFADAKEKIASSVRDGTLTHYSSEDYHLELKPNK